MSPLLLKAMTVLMVIVCVFSPFLISLYGSVAYVSSIPYAFLPLIASARNTQPLYNLCSMSSWCSLGLFDIIDFLVWFCDVDVGATVD